MRALIIVAVLAGGALPAKAQEDYGAKGIYPVYETAGQWLIYDKKPKPLAPSDDLPLARGSRFLVIGSQGAQLFTVARTSAAFGGACQKNRPIKLRAALLKGPRRAVGAPIIGIKVPAGFSLKGSRAGYLPLGNEVSEDVYAKLGEAVKAAVISEVKSGAFRFAPDDNPGPQIVQDPGPDNIQMKIDFGSRLKVQGLKDAFVFVEGSLVSATTRRCLRLADGGVLAAGCAEMPQALMAETSLLRFVAYDPGGQGNPYLLAYTPSEPQWGNERWGFVIRSSGPKLFLSDAMDPRCREGF